MTSAMGIIKLSGVVALASLGRQSNIKIIENKAAYMEHVSDFCFKTLSNANPRPLKNNSPKPHPSHRYPAKLGYVLLYSSYRVGKKLFSMQDKLVSNKQTHFLKQNFSATITPIDQRCEVLINL